MVLTIVWCLPLYSIPVLVYGGKQRLKALSIDGISKVVPDEDIDNAEEHYGCDDDQSPGHLHTVVNGKAQVDCIANQGQE